MRCAVAMEVEQWLEEMDKRGMVLDAEREEISSALQHESTLAGTTERMTDFGADRSGKRRRIDVLQGEVVRKRLATQIGYVGREPFLPSQVSLVDFEQLAGIDLSIVTTIYEDIRVHDAEELGLLRSGLKSVA